MQLFCSFYFAPCVLIRKGEEPEKEPSKSTLGFAYQDTVFFLKPRCLITKLSLQLLTTLFGLKVVAQTGYRVCRVLRTYCTAV